MTTAQLRQNGPLSPARHTMSKVPEVTALFWIIKVLTTGMGETASDYLAHVMDPMIAVALGGVALLAALAVQFAVRRYVAWIYWTGIVMVSVFGTMAADVLHVGLGVPYLVSTPFFLLALAAVFGVWFATERTLSIHSIHTRRREVFYWATVLATFALGTAAGDLTATTMSLGYLGSGIVFAALIAVPAVAHRWFGLGAIPSFWIAYVLTRPLGASFADWMAVSHDRGGLDLGLGPVTAGWTVAILALVGYLAATRRDVSR
ncbi:COG4705 family protein [Saccharothrix sp. ST-888]|uniref:COG4705 family protein n=1 Tax=Saccharothrix sp. ST-888 TaxID=1427391 RepID=UPI0005EBFDE7|nr:membrane protein [Saccharothrix sp. ST-888]KJK57488.1 membrane protein [Saccharothrix sp. ST-888]